MESVLTLLVIAIFIFAATNVDDIFLLMTWFSQAKTTKEKQCIIVGQYMGFIILLVLSLLGSYGALYIPEPLIGFLGLIPVYIGIMAMTERYQTRSSNQFEWVWKIAMVTMANGMDNISVYIPFFSTSSNWEIILIVLIFLLLVSVWCLIGYIFVRQPLITSALERYGHIVVPLLLIGLGIIILIEHGTIRSIWQYVTTLL